MSVVEVTDLVVRYGRVTAVDGLSLTAEAGEVLAVLGPNGAGKTTTVEALEGLRRPAAGSVRVLGFDPVRDHRRVAPHVGAMPQGAGLYPGIRAVEALRLFAAYYDGSDDPAALLERIGLVDRARSTWRQLSGGEQQRLSFALAVIGRPTVAFLDEPTAGVDVHGRQLVRAEVAALRARGVCVVLTTHELAEVEEMADRVAIVHRGRLRALGTPATLRADGAPEGIRFRAPAGLDVAALGTALGCVVEERRPGEYAAAVAGSPAVLASLTAWLAANDLRLEDLRAGHRSLEEVFLALTSDAGDDR